MWLLLHVTRRYPWRYLATARLLLYADHRVATTACDYSVSVEWFRTQTATARLCTQTITWLLLHVTRRCPCSDSEDRRQQPGFVLQLSKLVRRFAVATTIHTDGVQKTWRVQAGDDSWRLHRKGCGHLSVTSSCDVMSQVKLTLAKPQFRLSATAISSKLMNRRKSYAIRVMFR